MPALRVLPQVVAHQSVQPVKALAHVHGVQADVDPGGEAQAEHCLLGLSNADQAGQIGIAELPVALDAPAIAQHQREAP